MSLGAFQKGHKKRGGRAKGTKNKGPTGDAKVLVEQLIDYGLSRAEHWLERTAAQNPARALEALTKLLEYKLPKLSKADTNVTGGVEIIERRFYGAAPKVEILPANSMRALPESTEPVHDAEIEEID